MPTMSFGNVAKAGLRGLTHALARSAPAVRVNAVAPGPMSGRTTARSRQAERERILAQVPLGQRSGVGQIADAVKYPICNAHFVTGHTINVDGGRHCTVADAAGGLIADAQSGAVCRACDIRPHDVR